MSDEEYLGGYRSATFCQRDGFFDFLKPGGYAFYVTNKRIIGANYSKGLFGTGVDAGWIVAIIGLVLVSAYLGIVYRNVFLTIMGAVIGAIIGKVFGDLLGRIFIKSPDKPFGAPLANTEDNTSTDFADLKNIEVPWGNVDDIILKEPSRTFLDFLGLSYGYIQINCSGVKILKIYTKNKRDFESLKRLMVSFKPDVLRIK